MADDYYNDYSYSGNDYGSYGSEYGDYNYDYGTSSYDYTAPDTTEYNSPSGYDYSADPTTWAEAQKAYGGALPGTDTTQSYTPDPTSTSGGSSLGKSAASLASGLLPGLLSAFMKGTTQSAAQKAAGSSDTTQTATYADWAKASPYVNQDYASYLMSTGINAANQPQTVAQQQLFNNLQNWLMSPTGQSPDEQKLAAYYQNLMDTGGMSPAINTAQQGLQTLQNVYGQSAPQLQDYIANNVAGVGNLLGRSGVANQQALKAVQDFQFNNAQSIANQQNQIANLQAQAVPYQQQGATGLAPLLQTPQTAATNYSLLNMLNQAQQQQQQYGLGISNQGANLLNTLMGLPEATTSTLSSKVPTNVPSATTYAMGNYAQPVATLGSSLMQTLAAS